MSICIITDDNSGFTHEEAENLGITVLRMPVIIDGETFFENETIDTNTFYEKMNNGADIKTSQPSRKDIIDLWTEKLKTYDQILHIPMSSGLSNSCDNAKVLAQEFDGKVVVVDNHRISVTLKAAVRDAIALANKGLDAEAIKAKLEETAFDRAIYIMVDTLKYLKKGGRITPAAALIGEMVSIKPVLTLLGEKLDSFKKTIGVKKAKVVMLDAVEKDLETRFANFPREEMVFGVAYTYDLEEATKWKEEIMKRFNLDDVEMNPLSLSVATHIGPGALAITITHKLY